MNHDEQTRNECSSHSGVFHLFGFGYDESETKCSGSLEDTTQGQNTAVMRFTSRSYGTLPQVNKNNKIRYIYAFYRSQNVLYWSRPKIYLHIVAVTNILCQTKRWFAFSKIGLCAYTKVF